jgi:hypothetical protein
MAVPFSLTAEVDVAEIAPQNLGLGLMRLALEVAVELGLELEVKATLLTIELIAMRPLVMMLRLAVLGVLLGVKTLVLTRLTIELFQFLLAFLLHRLTAKTCLTAGVLNAMLAGARQAVERLATLTRTVGREPVLTRAVLGEVLVDGEELIATEPSSAVGAETAEETFHVLDDVREEEHTPINLDARRHAEVHLVMMRVGQDGLVGLRLHPGIVRIGVQRGGVGDVHFLLG